jgi:acetyltransferase-like isoleucine patch superfamily enzyme
MERYTIYPGTQLGERVTILPGAVIGRPAIANRNVNRRPPIEPGPAILADDVVIGANSVLYAGCAIGARTVICDLSSVRENVTIGEDCMIGRSVMINWGVRIGNRVRIIDCVHVGNMTIVEDDVFWSFMASTAVDSSLYLGRFGIVPPEWRPPIIRKKAVLGAGCVVMEGVEVGEGAVVAAGAVLTKSAPAYTIWAGVPAKLLREVDAESRRLVENETWLKGS